MAFGVLLSGAGLVCSPFEPAHTDPPLTKTNANPGFEEHGERGLVGWSGAGGSGWAVTGHRPREGAWAVALRGAGSGAEEWAVLVSDPIAVGPGDCVNFRVYVRSEGSMQRPLRAHVAGKVSGEWTPLEPVAEQCESRFAMGDAWHPRGYAVFTPQGCEEIRLELCAFRGESPDSTWFADDFSCRVVSFGDYVASRKDSERLPDIFLAGIDTLAQTPLACYGAERVATPTIDRLAKEGRLYTEVTTTCPWTKPSFASIFTSLYPSEHGVENVDTLLADEFVTLAEALRERGYFTAGFAFAAFDGYLGPDMGMAQGFDVYFHSRLEERMVSDALARFLDTNAGHLSRMKGGGLFVFLHVFEPHTPYVNRDAGSFRNGGLLGTVDIDDDHLGLLSRGDPTEVNDEDARYARVLYEQEVEYVDGLLGGLLEKMRRLGLEKKLNVVLCADHGESFGEKEHIWGHCHPYDTCVRTPLILRCPGRAIPSVRDPSALVSNLDIMPTLLDLAGANAPEQCRGRSLLSSDTAGEPRRYAICEDRRYGSIAVRGERYKLVALDASQQADPDEPYSQVWVTHAEHSPTRYELYDLDRDPTERDDVAGSAREAFLRLKAVFEDHCRRTGIDNPDGQHAAETIELSPETREQLEDLGYLGDDSPSARGELPHPQGDAE